jgi:hypothetical protein
MANEPGGGVKPLWMMSAVLACALAGATINQCLVCAPDGTTNLPTVSAAELRGAPIDGGPADPDPAPEPVTTTSALPAPAEAQPLPKLGEPAAVAEQESGEPALYKLITFDELASWTYEFPEIGSDKPRVDPVPERHRKMSGTRVAIQGFMIPIKLAGDDEVVEFLLVRNQFACCFGIVPKMNEWLHIKMAPGKVSKYLVDIPITVRGVFDASELLENGVVMSLYRMEADEVEEPALFR